MDNSRNFTENDFFEQFLGGFKGKPKRDIFSVFDDFGKFLKLQEASNGKIKWKSCK